MTERDDIDRRIAERLSADMQGVRVGLVDRLQEATSQGRRLRRRRKRAAAAIAAIAVAVPVAVAATAWTLRQPPARDVVPANDARLVGTFSTQVPSGTEVAAAGRWTLTLRPDGTAGLAGPVGYRGVLSGNSFQVAGSTVRINLFVQDRCASAPVGQYRWAYDGATLNFTSTSDACPFRRAVLTSGPWQPTG